MAEEKKMDAAAERELAAKKLRNDIDTVLTTEAGKRFMGYLCRICGYNKPSAVVDPATGDVRGSATIYNEARRAVYLQVRANADAELLKAIEYNKENQ